MVEKLKRLLGSFNKRKVAVLGPTFKAETADEYRNLDLERVKELMKGRVIFDLRNVLDIDEAKRLGFIYQGVGRK